ncbi:sulfate transporter [Oceanococcus atlanticus]|uniref:Sulfate transporter n=1 Tax=Oceanococcus atlanticus TaxID=1317117 RepID=A0A1Y1SDH0_9GAMM|nr:sulfate permease [Oceanococcus atlanticus]ORE87047.1 sulfate transporter [Oceanococcus atlanticus]
MRIPLIAHIRNAPPGAMNDDLIAGAITAILLIPQGMAYALLAGLPAEMGLYASIVPPALYALFGTSRSLAVGPVAVAALMVAAALSEYADGEAARWMSGAMILAFEVGALLFLMGVLRLGVLVNFISHPVLSGFTTGAALLIVLSQVPILLGLSLPRGAAYETVLGVWHNLDAVHLLTLVFSCVAMLALLLARAPLSRALRQLGMPPRAALLLTRMAPLAIVAVGALAAARLQGAEQGLRIVGAIPAGLPLPSLGFFAADGWLALAGPAVLIALVGYVESISVAKALAARRRQKIDPDQELRALGLANFGAAFAGTMPVAGGFSRSVVNFDAGAQTQRAALVTSALVAVVAVFFTHWFFNLPKAVLAAIIVVAVWQLVDFRSVVRHLRYDRADGASQVATLLGVLIFGIEPGLLIGIGLSLALYLWRTSQPHIALIGRVPGTEHFRNVQRHAVQTLPTAVFIRPDENLYFANVAVVQKFIADQVAEQGDITDVVLVMSAVSYIDASGLEMLEQLVQDFARAGIRLHLAEVKGPVMDRLKAAPEVLEHLPVHLSTEGVFEALQASSPEFAGQT